MTIEERLAKLERSCRHRRWVNFALGAVILLIVGVGAAQDRQGGKMVLDELVIRDKEGRKRILLGVFPNGTASIAHVDANGKVRIGIATSLDGGAGITHYDANDKMRITTATLPDGGAFITHYDANGKVRIN